LFFQSLEFPMVNDSPAISDIYSFKHIWVSLTQTNNLCHNDPEVNNKKHQAYPVNGNSMF
jgi:hypothetical protein